MDMSREQRGATQELEEALLQEIESGASLKARLIIDQLLFIDKNNVTAHFQAALIDIADNNLSGAIDHARTVLHINPLEGNAWLNLGVIYKMLGKVRRAVRCWNIELKRNPNSGETLFNLGLHYYEREHWDKAANLLQKCFVLDHSAKDIRIPIARCLYELRRCEEEIAFYRACLIRWPDDMWARSNLGAAYMDMNMNEKALINLKLAKNRGASYPNLIRNVEKLQREWPQSSKEA